MDKFHGSDLRIVLYEGPGSAPLGDDERLGVLTALLEAGYDVARSTNGCRDGVDDSTALVILGRFDERGPALIEDVKRNARRQLLDISALDSTGILTRVEQMAQRSGARRLGLWKPWFPVIDYDLCTNCMQCLSFCLFGVFGVDEKHVIRVQNQDHCKTDCPACSRVCPEVAIMFPKYDKEPINGDVVREELLQREALKVDVSALLGGDISSSLRGRTRGSGKRFSVGRDGDSARAESVRKGAARSRPHVTGDERRPRPQSEKDWGI